MAAGISHLTSGYLGFVAVKFAGYSLAARFFSHHYENKNNNSFVMGGVRTLIGMAAGAAYFGVSFLVVNRLPQTFQDAGFWLYLLGLVPVRVLEWWLLIWLFFDRELNLVEMDWRMVAAGTVWSYVCDIPAIIGLLVTGGVWVC